MKDYPRRPRDRERYYAAYCKMNGLYNGWRIEFRKNVHMYCHQLVASKGDVELEIPCEDTPDGFVGIWPYGLNADATIYSDLLKALHAWATTIGLNYRLYVTRDKFEQGV